MTGNYFHMLGVNAALGRTLGPEDSVVPGREPVVVLSYAAWQNKFGGDSDIVGKTIMVRATSLEVIGVTTQGFGGLGETPGEYWVPLTLSRQLEPGPDLFGPEQPERLNIVGRLRHGVSSTQAHTALAGWSKQMTADRPDSERAVGVTLESQATAVPFSAELLAAFSPIVAAFALVLLTACANVANMLLARALARRREIGVRLALGAARHRIVGQLLTEGFLLAIAAGVAGFAISQWTIQLAVAVMFDTLPADMAARVTIVPLLPDTRVFAFTLIAALVSAVVFGLAPAIQATRADLLLATQGEFTTDIRPMRLRNALVVAQITISVMLLICSGVLLRGAAAMGRSDVGFKTEGVVVVGVEAKDRRNAFEGMAAEPAVDAIAAAGSTPLNGLLPVVSMSLQATEKVLRASYNHVSPEYFAVLDIPIVKGRNFTPEEARARDPVAIISDATARRLLPDRDVVGQEIRIYGDARSNWGEQMPSVLTVRVIGVARDIVSCCLLYGKDAALIYFPVTAVEAKGSLLLRVRGDAAAASHSLDRNLARLVPGSVEELHPLSDGLALSTYPFRAASWISASLGALALLLAVSGIHGVLSYLITQRSKELAIRVALGGTTRAVAGLVLKQSMRLVTIGIGVGAALALGLSGFLAAQLVHVNAFDVVAYSGGMTLVSVAALAATYFPARRAARIDPMAGIPSRLSLTRGGDRAALYVPRGEDTIHGCRSQLCNQPTLAPSFGQWHRSSLFCYADWRRRTGIVQPSPGPGACAMCSRIWSI